MVSIEGIQRAREVLKDVIVVTPLEKNMRLSERYAANIYLKREDMQVVRSFKIRGAYYRMTKLTATEVERGIVCASAGNHAQGVALACKRLNIKGTIFMPTTTPKQKISRVEHFGGDWVNIILVGDTYDDSSAAADEYGHKHQLTYIHPFDDEEVITGQGTMAIEIIEQCPQPIDYLIVSVGGGGLIAGLGVYFKEMSPQTRIIAVEAQGAASLKAALDAGKVVTLENIDPFADGIATKKVGKLNLEICKEVVDQHVAIAEGKMCTTILELYNDEAIVVEPACASTISALDVLAKKIKGKTVVCVLSGGNNDILRTEEIRERSMLYEGRKHYFIVRFPQRSGALLEFLQLLGPNDDIVRFEYVKKNNRENGPAIIGIEFKDQTDFDPLVERLTKAGIDYQHLNKSPMLFELMV